MTSDEALMLEFQGGGSRAAFEELFARYRKPLYGFFGRRLNNPERAEDLTQETFLAVIRAASRYEPRASVRTYLYGIALKLLAAERRKFLTSSTSGGSATEPKTDENPECVLWVRQAMENLAAPAPALTMISPLTGTPGSVVPVTLSGSGLTCANSVNGFGALINVGRLTVANGGTTLTTNFTIGATAPAGPRNVSVTTPGGTTTPVVFTVLGPALTLSPTSLSFGNQPDRTTSTSQPVTLTNAGTLPVAITGISLTGLNSMTFTQSNNCPASPTTLAVGASCTVNVTFAPGLNGSSTTAGTKNANLSVAISGAATQTIALTGTTTVATVSFSTLVPSLVNGATTAHSGTITLTNNATSTNPGVFTLTATPTAAVSTPGPAGSSFTISGGTCVSGLAVPAGGTCTIVVTYNPNGKASPAAAARVTVSGTGAVAASQRSSSFNAN